MTDDAKRRVGELVRGLFVALGIAPFVPAWTEGVPGLSAVGRGLDAWFAFQCHRDAARSLAGSAVCVRCLGIYMGLAFGALVVRPRLDSQRQLAWILGAAVVLLVDVASEAFGFRPPSAPFRFVTGFGLAYPAGVAIVRALRARTRSRATAP